MKAVGSALFFFGGVRFFGGGSSFGSGFCSGFCSLQKTSSISPPHEGRLSPAIGLSFCPIRPDKFLRTL